MDASPSLRCKPPHRDRFARSWAVQLLLASTLLVSIGLALIPTAAHAQSTQIRLERRITREPLPIYQSAPQRPPNGGNGLALRPLSASRVLIPSPVPRPANLTTFQQLPRQR
jgi:hypothetical protein